MTSMAEVLKAMQVDREQLRTALRWAIDDASQEAAAAAITAPVTGRQGELRARHTAGRLALATTVYALLELELAREDAAAEDQALVAADLANSAERED